MPSTISRNNSNQTCSTIKNLYNSNDTINQHDSSSGLGNSATKNKTNNSFNQSTNDNDNDFNKYLDGTNNSCKKAYSKKDNIQNLKKILSKKDEIKKSTNDKDERNLNKKDNSLQNTNRIINSTLLPK